MITMLEIRMLLSKKRIISILAWMLVPVLLTMALFYIFNDVRSDFTVPVGIAYEEGDETLDSIVEEISENNLIDIRVIEENQAARLVEQHELDSAFVFDESFIENLQNLNRHEIITSYHSNRSLAYGAIKESIGSIVQEHYGLYYAHNMINEIEVEHDEDPSSVEEVNEMIDDLIERFNLLGYEYNYYGDITPVDEQQDINIFVIWALVSFFVTLFVFELIVSERRQNVMKRLTFTRYNMSKYFLYQVIWLTILLVISDFISWLVFVFFYDQSIDILVMLSLRLMMILFAYLLAIFIKGTYTYLLTSIFIVIGFIVLTYILLPLFNLQGLQWLNYINPLYEFLQGDITVYWNIGLAVLVLLFWRLRHA